MYLLVVESTSISDESHGLNASQMRIYGIKETKDVLFLLSWVASHVTGDPDVQPAVTTVAGCYCTSLR